MQMTVWMLSVYAEGAWAAEHQEMRRAAWTAWHGAALQRAKRMPKLKDLLGKPEKPQPGIDEAAIKARFAAYQQQKNMIKQKG